MRLPSNVASLPFCGEPLQILSLGNASFAFRFPGSGLIVLDPYLSHGVQQDQPGTEFVRAYDPPFEPGSLVSDVTLITHDHGDHLDARTLAALGRGPGHAFVGPPAVIAKLRSLGLASERELVELSAGTSVHLAGVSIAALPADHGDLGDQAVGYSLSAAGIRLCCTGDTVASSRVRHAVVSSQPDVLIAPFNGRDLYREGRGIDGNMDASEAVMLASEACAELLIGMHHDLFPNNALGRLPLHLAAERQAPLLPVMTMVPGQRLCFSPSRSQLGSA